MNNFMKLLSIFVVLIQIQIALCQSIRSPTGSNIIQELCKVNIYPSLCVSTLNRDPRSKNSDIKGIVLISVDATSKKFTETLEYLRSVYQKIQDSKDSKVLKRYEICITEYNTVVNWTIPGLLVELKDAKYRLAKSDMDSMVAASNTCESQFRGSSPLAERNKAIHDIAAMTADIIKLLYAN